MRYALFINLNSATPIESVIEANYSGSSRVRSKTEHFRIHFRGSIGTHRKVTPKNGILRLFSKILHLLNYICIHTYHKIIIYGIIKIILLAYHNLFQLCSSAKSYAF